MAKGNDGNLLQHAVEVEAAWHICPSNEDFSVVLTHGMKPYEPLGKLGSAGRKLEAVLGCATKLAAGKIPAEGQPTIVQGYAGVEATSTDYPNTARLLEWVASTKSARLQGVVCETVHEKANALHERYKGTPIRVASKSWRQALPVEKQPQCPWMLSMDPMSFSLREDPSSDQIGQDDIRSVAQWTRPILGQEAAPGIVAIFCYSMSNELQRGFAQTVCEAFRSTMASCPPNVAFLAIANKTSCHVAALVTRNGKLLHDVRNALNRIRLRLESHDLGVPNFWEKSI